MTATYKDPFVQRLHEVIEADPEITVSGLATKAGLTNSVIRAWFRDDMSPRLESARKVCAALGTTLEVFLSEAKTAEEKEIVRLVTELPEPLRRQLLGYGEALLAAERSRSEEEPEGTE